MWKPGTKGPGVIERASDEAGDIVVNKFKHLPLTTQRQKLPIFTNRTHILYLVENYRTVILVGETGCGKTTQIPQYLFEAGWADGDRVIGCTQPRRVAVQTVSARVAEEMGVNLGNEVGYTIRFDDKSNPQRTRVKFLTDGILLREMMSDPLLSRYSAIMVDEAHERSLYTDVLLGLLKKVQKRRKDLRVLVSSATLDAEAFRAFFLGDKPATDPAPGRPGRVAVMSMTAGRMYPVELYYLEQPARDYLEAALVTVLAIHAAEPAGDVLVFLTGAEECEALAAALHDRAGRSPGGLALSAAPLYAALPSERQLEAFAETPPGLRKMKAYDPNAGVDTLAVAPVSRAAATQRAGRAGRVRAGRCYRLCTEAAFAGLPAATPPEMRRADLAGLVLQLKALGVDDVLHFDFPAPPAAYSLARALELLYALGALDAAARLTDPLGLRMAEFPMEPALAKLVLASPAHGCTAEALTVAAMVSTPGVLAAERPGGGGGATGAAAAEASSARTHFAVREGDHVTLVNVYNAYEAARRNPEWCRARHVNPRAMRRAADTRAQLRRYADRLGLPVSESCGADPAPVVRCVAGALFANAARLESAGGGGGGGGGGVYRTVRGGRAARAHPSSVLHGQPAPWVVFQELMLTADKAYMLTLTAVDPHLLAAAAPHFYTFVAPPAAGAGAAGGGRLKRAAE